MSGKHWIQLVSLIAILAVCASAATADIISGNFCSVANVVNYPAGLVPVGFFNDLTGPAGYGASGSVSAPVLKFEDGVTPVPAGVTISWASSAGASQNTNDRVIRPMPPNTLGNHIDDGHDQLMTGYLQAAKTSTPPKVTLSGTGMNLVYGSYDLILYFDGDDDVEGPGQFAVTLYNTVGGAILAGPFYGRDSGDFPINHTVINSLADYAPVTSTISGSPTVGGNYVRFSGITSPTFYVEILGIQDYHGAALNGFQVVPEPATPWLLFGAGALVVAYRARRRKA